MSQPKLRPYWLPCGCYVRLIPDPLLAGPPNLVEQFTCEEHADIAKTLERLHQIEEGS